MVSRLSGPQRFVHWYPLLGLLSCVFGCDADQSKSVKPQVGSVANTKTEALFDDSVNRVALLVGINDYQAVNKLNGCVNDTHNIHSLLVDKFGFPVGNIRVLVDKQATRSAILKEFREHLIGKARKDTVVVFHYSGHGSRMNDPEKNPDRKTPSGKIGTIVPVDSRTKDIFDINANELRELFAELTKQTKNVTFILDSCHSGMVFKDVALARSVLDDEREPPAAFTLSSERSVEGFAGRDYALISACRADEVAFEYADRGLPCGTLTKFLAGELRRAAQSKVTYRDVMDTVKSRVNGVYQRQHPQLEGENIDNLVFSTEAVEAQPFVLASPKGDGVVLDAGRVHGVTEGSVFDVFPPGTKTFKEPEKPIARVEVTSVDLIHSVAKLVMGSKVQTASRSVERQHNFGDRKIPIYLDAEARGESVAILHKVANALKGTAKTDDENPKSPTFAEAFELAKAPTGARLILREIKETGAIAILGPDGAQLSPSVPQSESNPVEHILEQLTKWAKWFSVHDLSNPRPGLDVEFKIDRANGRDPALAVRPDLTLLHGDEIEFSVTNRGDRDIYFAILDLTDQGKIDVVYPGQGRNEALAPGRTYTIPDSKNEKPIKVSVPKGREKIRDYLKLIATQTDVDFRFLKQDSIKAVPRATDDPLMRLIGQSLLVEPRDVGQTEQLLDGWSTTIRILDVVTKSE